jgi:hypothetical protein
MQPRAAAAWAGFHGSEQLAVNVFGRIEEHTMSTMTLESKPAITGFRNTSRVETVPAPNERRRRGGSGALVAVAVAAAIGLAPGSSAAQDPPDGGPFSFSTGVDVPSTYVFRGYLQDDTGFIAWPFAELGVALFEGEGAVQDVSVTLGFWNSLHSGLAGSDGPSGKMWYERDFYAGLALGLARGVSVGTTYTSYMSPNNSFDTINELSVELAVDDGILSPYALLAFELDSDTATYLELGIGPGVGVVPDRLTLAFPVIVGLSLKDYYGSSRFGFLEMGAVAEAPLASGAFGSLNVQGGVSILAIGDGLKALNGDGKRSRVIGTFGIGLSY